ncbi:MAG: putative Secretion protein HlyD family precursor [candidate division NC10 bacterium]|jgi:RND family efflux transporter MFP subunit|nr:putative Secretion protein HlyD family precursor [candidate division NC10 bacterium]
MTVRWVFLGVLACGLGLAVSSAQGAQGNVLDCLIEPSQVVTISLPVEGLVETVTVDRGDLVAKGNVVATLESSVEQATADVARIRSKMEAAIKGSQIRIDFGERRFVRTDLAYREGGVPLKELDEAETSKVLAEISLLEARENQQLAEAELQRAEAALALRTVRSPISGVVLQRLISPGEFSKQAPLLKLAQLDPLYVEVIVPVTTLGKISPGMLVLVTPEPPLRAIYTAQVKVVDRVIDAASGTFGVRLELPNPKYAIPAGLKCKVRFPE